MSTEQTNSTGDLRSRAQDYKRDATRKHKWALGATGAVGRADANPRPQRPSETHYNYARRMRGAALAEFNSSSKHADAFDSSGADSNSDDGFGMPSPSVEPSPIYSFDAIRSPSQGSQILNAALAKAVERFEEKETAKLVKNEYDVLDIEGEVVGLSKKAKARKTKAVEADAAADEDYEFV